MSERTGNKIWVGIAAGLLTTAVLAMVGIGAYRAGQRSDQTIEVVGQVAGEGDVARTVVVDGWRIRLARTGTGLLPDPDRHHRARAAVRGPPRRRSAFGLVRPQLGSRA